jgi:PIN domain nuclease of toxin-antitoxin system
MKSIILDSSAVIALLKGEPGHNEVRNHVKRAVISAVNMTEVATYLARAGSTLSEVQQIINRLPIQIIPFDESFVAVTGILYQQTKNLGLSLGDRACLALGLFKKLPILTSDRVWEKLNIHEIEVRLIR